MQREPDLQQVASSLAVQGIESHELALDLILHDLAEQACQLTGASGAAIALDRDGEVVCRAAAGATAPDLGVRINTDSGLTGACWRLGEPQLCTDTRNDPRVDAEASRRLGVRSLLVVPLLSGTARVGVFEVFSPRPFAFGDQDLEKLQDLGKSVIKTMLSAAERASRQTPGPVLVSPAAARPTARSPESLYRTVSEAAKTSQRTDGQTRALRLVVLALATVLCILLGFRWGWDKAKLVSSGGSQAASQSEQQVAAPGQSRGTSEAIPNAQAAKRPAGLPSSPQKQPGEGSLVVYQDGSVVFKQNAAERVKLPETSTTDTQKTAAANRPTDSTKRVSPKPEEIAELTSQLSLGPPSLPALQPPALAAPALPTLRVSQGVTGGKLIRRIPPRYPQQAMQQRVQGLVVVQAEIGKDGRVKSVKALSGNSLLAAAALNAVREWRFEPFKLNGEAVGMTTQVTLNFTLE